MTVARSPSSAAARARVSSKRSGFRFCGMIDEPVDSSSGSTSQPNSSAEKRITSAESLAQMVRRLAAPEERRRLEHAAAALHRGHDLIDPGEAERLGRQPRAPVAAAHHSLRRCRAGSDRGAPRSRAPRRRRRAVPRHTPRPRVRPTRASRSAGACSPARARDGASAAKASSASARSVICPWSASTSSLRKRRRSVAT